jgi:hypothetical protein
MSLATRNRRFSGPAAALVAAVSLCALAVPSTPAKAQVPYLGVDFGNGFGIGIGAPPSAYGMAPASVFYPPYYYPPQPRYYYPRRARYYYRY